MKSKKYKVLIIETLEKIVEVSAEDENQAELMVKQMYRNEEVVLEPECITDTTIRIWEDC